MVGQDRMKRSDPKRTKPIRQYAQFVHRPNASAEPQKGVYDGGGGPPGRAEGAIGEAVKLAYDVAEKQIAQGRRAAQRVRDGSYRSADLEDDIKTQIDQMLRLSKELSVRSFDILDSIVKASANSIKNGADAAPVKVIVEVKSSQPAEVTVELWQSGDRAHPKALPLCEVDSKGPPIEDVHLVAKDGRGPVLIVKIPDKQPAGVYNGVVVDTATRQPIGAISVCVQP